MDSEYDDQWMNGEEDQEMIIITDHGEYESGEDDDIPSLYSDDEPLIGPRILLDRDGNSAGMPGAGVPQYTIPVTATGGWYGMTWGWNSHHAERLMRLMRQQMPCAAPAA